MQSHWLGKLFGSIFTRLLLVLILTGLCINMLVGGFFRHFYASQKALFQTNLTQYASYLVQDLGSPPNFERAQALSAELAIGIGYEGLESTWTTSEEIVSIDTYRKHVWRRHKANLVGEYHDHYFLLFNQGPDQFVFVIDEIDDTRQTLFVLGLLVLLTVVLGIAYWAIRRILHPIRWLNEGVQQISQGNLNHEVPARRVDELGDLARAFNAMTARIRHMLRSKEQLLLDVSHELRSPLTRVKVALEFMSKNKIRQNIHEDISEMETMIGEILENARLRSEHGHLEVQPVNLMDLIKQETEGLTCQAPGIDLQWLPQEVMLPLDTDRVCIVLKNILSNALKYSDAEKRSVKVTYESQNEFAVLHIRDFGAGIPPEELPYIFEPFYRVDKSRSKDTGGYGLGLNLCKTIMDAHHGKIEVESTLGEGTQVSLFFPKVLTASQ